MQRCRSDRLSNLSATPATCLCLRSQAARNRPSNNPSRAGEAGHRRRDIPVLQELSCQPEDFGDAQAISAIRLRPEIRCLDAALQSREANLLVSPGDGRSTVHQPVRLTRQPARNPGIVGYRRCCLRTGTPRRGRCGRYTPRDRSVRYGKGSSCCARS